MAELDACSPLPSSPKEDLHLLPLISFNVQGEKYLGRGSAVWREGVCCMGSGSVPWGGGLLHEKGVCCMGRGSVSWEEICVMGWDLCHGGNLCHGRGSVSWERICVMGGHL